MATLVRRLYDDVPPPLRSFPDEKPTLLVSWWCTCFALAIIVSRVAGRFIRTERLFREDKVMAVTIIPLMLRMGLVHVVLLWGTNNTMTEGLTPLEIHHKEIASQLVLASRIMYAAVLWIQKFSITEFFKRIIAQSWKRSYQLGLQTLRWFLLATFLAVVVGTLAECQPFDRYWQVVPDPGPKCRQGYAQLLTMGIVDVVTDFMIVGFPIPIILKSQMTMKRKFELIFLFALSLGPTAITCYRVPSIIDRQGRQQFRSLWASVEILFATAAANALVLGSFVRDRGPKKTRFKVAASVNDSFSQPSTRRPISNQYWGSDEDLVHGLGLCPEPSLRVSRSETAQRPRPAPMADAARSPVARARSRTRRPPPISSGGWQFPPKLSEKDEKASKLPQPEPAHTQASADASSPGETSILTPRRVSFFDVGGLLEAGGGVLTARDASLSTRDTAAKERVDSQDFALAQQAQPAADGDAAATRNQPAAMSQRRGSRNPLLDLGGLLSRRRAESPATTSATAAVPATETQRAPTTSMTLTSALQTSESVASPEKQESRGAAPVQDVLLRDEGGLLS